MADKATMKQFPLLAVLLLSACGSADSMSKEQACTVAESYVGVMLADQVGSAVFTETAEDLPDRLDVGEWYSSIPGGVPGAPSPKLAGALKAGGGVSAVKMCANVRALLDRKGIAYGTRAVEEASAVGKDGNYHAAILGISLPVVSDDGKYALLASSQINAPEAAGGYLQHLQHQIAGPWVVVGWSGLWIS